MKSGSELGPEGGKQKATRAQMRREGGKRTKEEDVPLKTGLPHRIPKHTAKCKAKADTQQK